MSTKLQKIQSDGQKADDATDYTDRVIKSGSSHLVKAIMATLEEGADPENAIDEAYHEMQEIAAKIKAKPTGAEVAQLGLEVSKHIGEANSDKYISHGVGEESTFRGTLGNGHPFWNDQQTAQGKFFKGLFEKA